MMLIVYVFVILISQKIIYGFEMAKDENNFGPYDVRWTKYNLCPGSKPKTSTNISFSMEKQNDDFLGNLTIDVLVQTSLNQVRVWVYKVQNEKKSLLWVYKTSDACKHYIFADIIRKELNAKNCVIEKGSRNIFINFTEITRKMLGTSFFYGNYSMKAIATSNKANFLCLVVYLEFYKKNN